MSVSTFWEKNIICSKFCGKNMIGSTFWEKDIIGCTVWGKNMTDSTFGKKTNHVLFPECAVNHVFPRMFCQSCFYPRMCCQSCLFPDVLSVMFSPRICCQSCLFPEYSGKKYGWQHILEKNIIGIKFNGKNMLGNTYWEKT
jgi:hypothetical protein